MRYFPDSCYKRTPPRDYFLKVLYSAFRELYHTFVDVKADAWAEKHKRPDENFEIERDMREIIEAFKPNETLI